VVLSDKSWFSGVSWQKSCDWVVCFLRQSHGRPADAWVRMYAGTSCRRQVPHPRHGRGLGQGMCLGKEEVREGVRFREHWW